MKTVCGHVFHGRSRRDLLPIPTPGFEGRGRLIRIRDHHHIIIRFGSRILGDLKNFRVSFDDVAHDRILWRGEIFLKHSTLDVAATTWVRIFPLCLSRSGL
jgi:hypothetical protein